MNITLVGYGRLGKLISTYLGRDFSLHILEQNKTPVDLEKIRSSQIIIFSVPISDMPQALKEIAPYINKNTLAVDTCSVKEWPLNQMKAILPENVEILGSHPMFGPDSVKDTLFGTKLVLCPVRISDERLNSIIHYLQNHGIKIIETSAEKHDQQMSSSLLISHFIGKGLLEFGAKEQEIDTKGYRRLLRILETVQNDSDILFRDMFKYNKFAKNTLKHFLSSLEQAKTLISE